MSRPLLVTDCDEVLLHMVRHFSDWLDEEHEVDFALQGNSFLEALRWRKNGKPLVQAEVWSMLQGFFETQMKRQTPVSGAVEAIAELQREADVVVLTNLTDEFRDRRVEQLRAVGISAPVYTNQGPKGAALQKIFEERGSTRAAFIDDLAQHIESAAVSLPETSRLHFCGEPSIAPHIGCAYEAGHAHARIDNWAEALPWLQQALHGE